MPDLRFVTFQVPSYPWTIETSAPPPEVVVQGPYWYYRGQCFVIGHGVRAPEDGECEGPLFVYDYQNPTHVAKAQRIQAELAEYGQLILN